LIRFKTLSWKNFLSTGNYKTTVDFCRHDNTLVSGENGAGKSTMLDALTFALFGKSFRGINIPQLVNSVNEKNCEVEIDFDIGKDEYRVIRGMKPKRFEIYKNDSLLDQDAKARDYQKILEEQILKMTYRAFCQVVILGSSNYVPFMKLPTNDRRAVVENLLDIDVFSTMNVLVKGRLQILKETLKDVEHKMELCKTRVEDKQKLILVLQKKSKESSDKYQTEIDSTRETIQQIENEVETLRQSVVDLMATIPDKDTIPQSLIEQERHQRKLEDQIKSIDKTIKFYEENDSCQYCKQDIQEHHKESMVEEQAGERTTASHTLEELKSGMNTTTQRLNEINQVLQKIASTEKEISSKQSDISASLQYVSKMQKNIDSLRNESSDTDKPQEELAQLITEGKGHVDKKKELIEDKHYYGIASSLLKDTGIKAKIIKHYLPIMNRLINKYLSDMDFFCQFHLDENFDETIKSRHRDEFSYHSFSEGERLRIDLSMLLAWREVARMKNSVNCNLLILDEVFDSSLDGVGTEEFLKLLNAFGKKANIFVISHKSDTMTDKFQNHIVFEKKNNFSRIK